MPTSIQKIRSAIAQEAAEWFVMNRGGAAISADDRAAFGAWLKTSPLHVEEYLKTATMARDLHIATRALDTDIDSLTQEASKARDPGVVSIWTGAGVRNTETRRPFKFRHLFLAGIAAI